MKDVKSQLDEIEIRIMSGLKDFQRATVNRIDELYRQGEMRILVSDEVGLGKTLIARGTVAKFAKMRKEQGDELVKIVYICSNAAIADQNLNKLRITQEVQKEQMNYSRLSMQHLNIFLQENDKKLRKSYIQLIPLTPDTSFRLTSGAGTVGERALMFAILRRLPELSRYLKALEVALIDMAPSAWESWAKKWYEDEVVRCDNASNGKYLSYMLDKVSTELLEPMEEDTSYLSAIIFMCQAIEKNDFKRVNNNNVIGKLRVLFAKISLDKLEPDLIIMDEFQRFKFLLSADEHSETGMLAKKFFNSEKVRMLLLSATPYKMYSTLEEIDETLIDEHYTEFLSVMNFLNITDEKSKEFQTIWQNYSMQLKELSVGQATVISAKKTAEQAMYQNVCRTERISEPLNADMIEDLGKKENDSLETTYHLMISEADVKSYLDAQRLIEDIGANFHIPVDYIKSAPYLMSFMKDYQLKRYVEKYFKRYPDELSKIKKSSFWITRKSIDNYEKIPANNARLETVMKYIFQQKAEKLLWVPPSRPYYDGQGPFKDIEHFSKILIFSSWEMVPRMLTTMISYEAERRTVGSLLRNDDERATRYFYNDDDARRYPPARMKFVDRKDGKAGAMYLFCFLYPSKFLTECYNPVECMNRGMTLNQIRKEIKQKIREKLKQYPSVETGPQDNRWYSFAPLLFDNAGYVTNWLNDEKLLVEFDTEDDVKKERRQFQNHWKTLREMYYESEYGHKIVLGKKPDDLLDVLTDMAIASPAISVNRTYSKYIKSERTFACMMPSQIAKLFITRMNSLESTAVIELVCGRKSDDAHWKNVLEYCVYGNLQAMFDEYAHICVNGLDDGKDLIENLHCLIAESMTLQTTGYNVDTYQNFSARVTGRKEKNIRMRSHFAVAFTKGDGREKDSDRKKRVRKAFNSPFRPFVLASTSIGQEGLDFHNYCRKIVHWNLPSNPIDLEQREGRINRFECLAIRQTIAERYGRISFEKENVDIWEAMFQEAKKKEQIEGCSELIPYWGIQEKPYENCPPPVRVERLVPMYPFSRDENQYERLLKILSHYRLTLGQARQEELLEYIFNNHAEIDNWEELFINLSPYYRRERKDIEDSADEYRNGL